MSTVLQQSYKGAYPFRLACPSFIYPAGYVENVQQLGAFVDEIELLLLESAPDCLPARADFQQLKTLAADLEISYNIHLPTDISPGAADASERACAVDALLRTIDEASLLSPTSYTLHLPYAGSTSSGRVDPAWQDRIEDSLHELLTASGLSPEVIAIETLDYPPHFLDRLLDRLALGICLDTGHLMVAGHDIRPVFDAHQHRLPMIHTHGVCQGRDHLGLDQLDEQQTATLLSILREFHGSLSLEVFSLPALAASIDYLGQKWHNK